MTMTDIIHTARPEYRYGTRILEVDWENHSFTTIDESEGWCSLEQAKRYVENTKNGFDAIVGAKWEVQIYRYKVTVENLCGKKWTNICP